LLTGQAADELFGGYPWYRVIVEREGYAQFQFRMQDDLLQLYKETLEREDKITMAHSIELRVPYLDPDVITTAMSIAPQLKVLGGDDVLGKHVHRELAVEMGIPEEWAMRPKEAAQHGAGTHDLLDGLARRYGFSPQVAERVGYSVQDNVAEQLGSSARYGYRYSDPQMWEPQDHVQLFLDWVAYQNNLLNEADRATTEEFLTGVRS
jgi:asparagine synthase (glutamine-hydrolysing)